MGAAVVVVTKYGCHGYVIVIELLSVITKSYLFAVGCWREIWPWLAAVISMEFDFCNYISASLFIGEQTSPVCIQFFKFEGLSSISSPITKVFGFFPLLFTISKNGRTAGGQYVLKSTGHAICAETVVGRG